MEKSRQSKLPVNRERLYNASNPGVYMDGKGRWMLEGVQIGDSVDRSTKDFYLAAKRFSEIVALLEHRLQTAGEVPSLTDMMQLAIALKLIRGRLQYSDLRSVCQLHFQDILTRDGQLPNDWWPIMRPALEDRFHVFSAEESGNTLGLSVEERAHLKIKTIRAAGMTDEMQAAQRRAKKAEAEKIRRRKNGARPREEYEQDSIAAKAREDGISRSTLYRHNKHATGPWTIGSVASSDDHALVAFAAPMQKGETR